MTANLSSERRSVLQSQQGGSQRRSVSYGWFERSRLGDIECRRRVVLDMLQKADPLDRKLGNNIYWFYVEPPSLAPLFLGPLQAGADLGDIVVGPLLEARGEVRGTPEELAAFSAEWDQPEPMKRGNGEIGWYYAESKPLETKRDGDKLTFHLTGLRPGKLRIVPASNRAASRSATSTAAASRTKTTWCSRSS